MTCYLEGREDPCQCWPPCLGHEHEAVLVHSRDRRKWLRCACAKLPRARYRPPSSDCRLGVVSNLCFSGPEVGAEGKGAAV